MNDDDITGLSVGSGDPFTTIDNYSWGVIPKEESFCDNTDIQKQVYELVSKNYSLEYKNKELTDKVNNLETDLLELMCKVEDLQQIIIKICEDYILSDDD